MKENLQKGKLGEEKAADYLKGIGWKIIERNFHSRLGEVDIIAEDSDRVVVFCEVKTYKEKSQMHPLQSISYKKRVALTRTAQWYLSRLAYQPNARFDLIIVWDSHIERVENIIEL